MDKDTYTSEHLSGDQYVDKTPTSYPEGFTATDPPTDWQDWCLAERRAILEQATARTIPCPKEYLDRDILTRWDNMQNRDILAEIEGELLDIVNYAVAQIIKLRVIAGYLNE